MHLKKFYRNSLFNDSLLGFFINSSYIARASLYRLLYARRDRFHNLKVLDVGCGSKPYNQLFRNTLSYIGLDTHKSGHDHSQENIDVFYDGSTFPFSPQSFYAVVSFQVFEHVEDEKRFLKEINKVLSPNGLLLMTLPFSWPEHEEPYDFRRMTSFGMRKMIEENGFEVLELIKTTNYLQTVLQLINTYLAQTLKTPWPVMNIFLSLLYVPFLNLLSFSFGIVSKRSDYFCDLMVLAKKKTLPRKREIV